MAVNTTPEVSGLAASSEGIDGILLVWVNVTDGCLPYVQPSVVEVWRNTTNDRSDASKINEVEGNSYTDTGFSTKQTYYYWIRARTNSGEVGPWEPSGVNSGVSATPTASNDELFTQTPIAPSNLVARSGVGVLALEWNNPGSPVRNIEVFWALSGNAQPSNPQRQVSSGNGVEISSNLTADTDYDFWIRASNGDSLKSSSIGPQTARIKSSEFIQENARKIVFAQSSQPSNPQEGWLWRDTDNGNLYRYTGSFWEQIGSSDALNLTNSPAEAGADVTQNNANAIILRQSGQPVGAQEGWFWVDTDTDDLFRYDGFSWVKIGSLDISRLNNAGDLATINQADTPNIVDNAITDRADSKSITAIGLTGTTTYASLNFSMSEAGDVLLITSLAVRVNFSSSNVDDYDSFVLKLDIDGTSIGSDLDWFTPVDANVPLIFATVLATNHAIAGVSSGSHTANFIIRGPDAGNAVDLTINQGRVSLVTLKK